MPNQVTWWTADRLSWQRTPDKWQSHRNQPVAVLKDRLWVIAPAASLRGRLPAC